MKPLDGDAALLLRAGRRCGALALELDRLDKALSGATDNAMLRWSGTAAASFGAMAHAHRGTVQGARAAVERLGMLTSSFAHELADAQVHVKCLPEDGSVARKAVEDRITMLRRRFHEQSLEVESEMKQLLLRRPVDPPPLSGPVRDPGDWPRNWPFEPPPLSGPVRAPGDWVREWPFKPPPLSGPVRDPRDGPGAWPFKPPPLSGPVRPVPAPAAPGSGAAQLPWTPPWLNGSGHEPARTLVQPVGVGT